MTSPAGPGPSAPVPGQPVAGQPVAGQPVAGQPVAGQPVAGQPVAGQPVPERVAPTGHPDVDAALARLAEVGELPPEQQVPAYESAHQALRQTLASIDG